MSKLSKSTIAKLKNFATIQPNLVYKGDGKLTTLAEANNIMAVTEIEESIDVGFGIYDLNEFLSAYGLITDPTIEFTDKQAVIQGGNIRVEYKFANTNILHQPKKDITMPPADAEIEISADDIGNLRRAASTFGYNILSISHKSESDKVELTVEDSANAGGTTYTISRDWTGDVEPFNFKFLIGNLKLLDGDYKVSLSKKFISKWVGEEVTYWIAIETSSTYGA